MQDVEEQLEHQLLELGARERRLNELIKDLQKAAKESVQAGDGRADKLCSTVDDLKSKLQQLMPEISEIERRLYGMRRRKR